MASKSQRPKGNAGTIAALNAAIESLDVMKGIVSIEPAKSALGLVSGLLAMIRDYMVSEKDYVDLGLECVRVCEVLSRVLKDRRLDELNQSALKAIEFLTTTVADIQDSVVKQYNRSGVSRFVRANGDKNAIAGLKDNLNRALRFFDTELIFNTHVMVNDLHRNGLTGHGGARAQHPSTSASIPPGEVAPPPPRDCFGREELIEEIIALAKNLEPIALIGAGGIGKTSIALTVLQRRRIKKQFGDNRRFIRCDQFPASRANFLARLSKVIGAGVENPEDIAPLRPLLSSQQMLIVLDNAESILDPHGPNCQEIRAVVDELCRFKTICVCITSRITTVPPYCKRPQIGTLSIEAARNIFYGIHGDGGRSGIIDDLLQRLEFHALSITLLATAASNNMWSYDRLAKEWDKHRTGVLRTNRNESLATTIELSLASRTFRKLGHNARDLLGVVAFFPQGIDEKNLDWLFPTIPDRKKVFDKFCVLSLTHRNNGFITMLAPIRDHLCPRDPGASLLLCTTKNRYFTRLSIRLDHNVGESRWIVSEDVNVEHLLDVFISIDMDAPDVWDACSHFVDHLCRRKPQQTVLRSKIEGLPDGHPSKSQCLFSLSQLLKSVGNFPEEKRLLTRTLNLQRKEGGRIPVAHTLRSLSDVNRRLRLPREGIPQAEEALEMYKQLGNVKGQSTCLDLLARFLLGDNQLDAAERVAFRKIDLLPEKGQEVAHCQTHRLLGTIYRSKGEKEKAIRHFEMALTIASPFDWPTELFGIHQSMATLFLDEHKLDDANVHIEQAKLHTADSALKLGCGMKVQAEIWHEQRRLGDAKSEALDALEIFKRLGADADAKGCRDLLRRIEKAIGSRISGESDSVARGAPRRDTLKAPVQRTGRMSHS